MLIERFIKKIVYFGISSIELVKLKFYKKIINVFALFILDFIVIVFASFMFLFIGIGFSLLINSYLNNNFLGFLIVGFSFGLVAALILIFFKNSIMHAIQKRIYKYLIK